MRIFIEQWNEKYFSLSNKWVIGVHGWQTKRFEMY